MPRSIDPTDPALVTDRGRISVPDDAELLALFGCEPTLLDPGVPWRYNTLTFRVERDGFSVLCRLSPSYATLRVTLSFEGREVAEAELDAFKSLEVVSEGEREMLIARFGPDEAALVLSMKPHVRLFVTG